MARNIGESLNDKNIQLNTNESKILGKENAPNNNSIHNEKSDENPGSESHLDTLNETITETLCRDLTRIGHKIEYVLLPRFTADKSKQLRNWDLWGPLLLCICLSLTLSFSSNDKGNIFVTIFVIVWAGAFVITVNTQALGSKISIFQSICLLGYCLFPLDIAAIIISIIPNLSLLIKFIICMVAFLWSYLSSIGFMSQLIESDKKFLATYPIFLFYLFLACFVLNTKK